MRVYKTIIKIKITIFPHTFIFKFRIMTVYAKHKEKELKYFIMKIEP